MANARHGDRDIKAKLKARITRRPLPISERGLPRGVYDIPDQIQMALNTGIRRKGALKPSTAATTTSCGKISSGWPSPMRLPRHGPTPAASGARLIRRLKKLSNGHNR